MTESYLAAICIRCSLSFTLAVLLLLRVSFILSQFPPAVSLNWHFVLASCRYDSSSTLCCKASYIPVLSRIRYVRRCRPSTKSNVSNSDSVRDRLQSRQFINKLCGRPPQYAPASHVTLTFNLLTLKLVSESRVTWATSAPILVFLSLSVLDLDPMIMTGRGTVNIVIRLLGGCIVLAYSVIAWGSFDVRDASTVLKAVFSFVLWVSRILVSIVLLFKNSPTGMQFLLSFHRLRRLLNSATAALSSRIDAHTLAGPLARSACLLSPRHQMLPRDVKLPARYTRQTSDAHHRLMPLGGA